MGLGTRDAFSFVGDGSVSDAAASIPALEKFKICIVSLCVILVISFVVHILSGILSPGSSALGVITKPFQQFFTEVAGGISNFAKSVGEGNKLIIENKQLEEELNELRGVVAENDELKLENEFYKDYLEIKDQNPDFKFCDAKPLNVFAYCNLHGLWKSEIK